MTGIPIYRFENTSSTGIKEIPFNAIVLINDTNNGIPGLYLKLNNDDIAFDTISSFINSDSSYPLKLEYQAEDLNNKNQANGYAGLRYDRKIEYDLIPIKDEINNPISSLNKLITEKDLPNLLDYARTEINVDMTTSQTEIIISNNDLTNNHIVDVYTNGLKEREGYTYNLVKTGNNSLIRFVYPKSLNDWVQVIYYST